MAIHGPVYNSTTGFLKVDIAGIDSIVIDNAQFMVKTEMKAVEAGVQSDSMIIGSTTDGSVPGPSNLQPPVKPLKIDSTGRLEVIVISGGGASIVGLKNLADVQINPATEDTLTGVLTTTAWQVRTNTLGQKAMAASMPMVIASDQSDLPVRLKDGLGNAITSDLSGARRALSMHVINSAGAIVDSFGTDPVGLKNIAAVTINPATEDTLTLVLTTAAFQARINTLGQKAMVGSTPIVIASDQSAVPVSGTISIGNIPHVIVDSGAITVSGTVAVSNAFLLDATFTTRVPVNGQALMAASIPVVIASNQSAVPISGTVAVSNAFLLDATFTARVPVNGQAAMAASIPVVIASNQSAVPISGTIAVSNAFLLDATFTSRVPVNGQAAMAASIPVVIASNQSAVPISGTVAVSNAFLLDATFTTRIPVNGQALMAASIPVVIASNQSAVPISGTIAVSNAFALDATLVKLTIAQGTALGANTQALVGGSVTTAAPTYTTGQISPLSLTIAGALRIDGSGVTQPVSGTITANQGGAPWTFNLTQWGSVVVAVAATLADDMTSNPVIPRIGAVMMGMDSAGADNVDRVRLAKVHDMDSGAGTEYAVGISLRKSASGGSLEYGTSTDPIRNDPTGTTTQPVSGTVAVSSVIPGTAATNLGKAEDVGHITGDTGVMILGVANSGDADISGSNADYTPLSMTQSGIAMVGVPPRNVIVLASGARTTTQTQADQTNFTGRGLIVVLDVTVIGTGSITLSIQGKDPNGIYYTILTGLVVITGLTNVYRVYPTLAAVANATAADVLPRTWRVIVTHNNANSVTYSVGAIVVP